MYMYIGIILKSKIKGFVSLNTSCVFSLIQNPMRFPLQNCLKYIRLVFLLLNHFLKSFRLFCVNMFKDLICCKI